MKVIVQHIEMKIEIMIRHNAVDRRKRWTFETIVKRKYERAQVKYLKLSFHG